jgi:hypothetical protein
MGMKFEILAAHYPFKGYYEETFQCSTLWSALKQFRQYQRQGYEIIDVSYRNIKEQFTWAGEM